MHFASFWVIPEVDSATAKAHQSPQPSLKADLLLGPRQKVAA